MLGNVAVRHDSTELIDGFLEYENLSRKAAGDLQRVPGRRHSLLAMPFYENSIGQDRMVSIRGRQIGFHAGALREIIVDDLILAFRVDLHGPPSLPHPRTCAPHVFRE
jgi:hypothetical protein